MVTGIGHAVLYPQVRQYKGAGVPLYTGTELKQGRSRCHISPSETVETSGVPLYSCIQLKQGRSARAALIPFWHVPHARHLPEMKGVRPMGYRLLTGPSDYDCGRIMNYEIMKLC